MDAEFDQFLSAVGIEKTAPPAAAVGKWDPLAMVMAHRGPIQSAQTAPPPRPRTSMPPGGAGLGVQLAGGGPQGPFTLSRAGPDPYDYSYGHPGGGSGPYNPPTSSVLPGPFGGALPCSVGPRLADPYGTPISSYGTPAAYAPPCMAPMQPMVLPFGPGYDRPPPGYLGHW